MISPNRQWLGGFVLVIALVPSLAHAQSMARFFDELQGILKAGDIVLVIDKVGQETPGKVAEVSTSALILEVAEKTPEGLWKWTSGVRRTFAAASVAEILRSDSSGRKGTRTYLASFQTPATTLSELASLVTPGTTVIMADRSGGSVRGKFASIAGGSLVLAVDGHDRTLAEGDLKEVRVRVRDTVWDGAAIGFLAGFVVPAGVCTSGSDASETVPCIVGSMLLGGLPGLGIGIATDAARARHVTVFRAPANGASAGLTVAPVIGGRAGLGLRMTVRY